MRATIFYFFVLATLFSPSRSVAQRNCVDLQDGCSGASSSSLGSSSSKSSQIRINPAAVPTDKVLGIEGILYKGEVDFMLAQGTGRMGAAISPSNAESTFFGPPALEMNTDLFDRKYNAEKYKGQKLTLATAFNLYSKKGSGFRKASLNLGVMGKYNKETKTISPGVGLNGNWGLFSFGYSTYTDETQLEDIYTEEKQVFKYDVQTYNFGVYLNSLTLDYSKLTLNIKETLDPILVDLYTANLAIGRFNLTLSHRIEKSDSFYYDFEEKILKFKETKEENFGGVQYRLTKNILIGALYNYYLLREYSAHLTLLF